MSKIPPACATVLAAINRCTPVSSEDFDGGGEWFYLESATLEDIDLYKLLRRNWPRIAGANALVFALLYCEDGDDAGVWLHHLGTHDLRVEYLHGCYQVPSWS